MTNAALPSAERATPHQLASFAMKKGAVCVHVPPPSAVIMISPAALSTAYITLGETTGATGGTNTNPAGVESDVPISCVNCAVLKASMDVEYEGVPGKSAVPCTITVAQPLHAPLADPAYAMYRPGGDGGNAGSSA